MIQELSWWRRTLTTILVALLPAVALAEPRSDAKVVVVTGAQETTTLRRLEAELKNLNVEVVRITAPTESVSIRKELKRITQEQGAFAAVRIVPSDAADEAEAEVWVFDRVTGKTLVREVLSGKRNVELDDAVSLGAVELLRASLLEVSVAGELKGDFPPAKVAPELLPQTAATSERTPRPRRPLASSPELWLSVAPSLDSGVGRLTTGASLELSLRLLNAQGLGVEFVGREPFVPQEVRAKAGTATLTSRQLGLLVDYGPAFGHWSPALGLGFAATSVTTHGHAAPPRLTQEEHRLRFAPLLRAGLGYRPLPYLGIRLDMMLAYATSPLAIRIAGDEVAEHGRPSVALATGVELRLPLADGP